MSAEVEAGEIVGFAVDDAVDDGEKNAGDEDSGGGNEEDVEFFVAKKRIGFFGLGRGGNLIEIRNIVHAFIVA